MGDEYKASLVISGKDKQMEQKTVFGKSLTDVNVQIRFMGLKTMVNAFFKDGPLAATTFDCIILMLQKLMPQSLKYLVNEFVDKIKLYRQEQEKLKIVSEVKEVVEMKKGKPKTPAKDLLEPNMVSKPKPKGKAKKDNDGDILKKLYE